MQSVFNGIIVIKGWSKVIESVYEKISDDSKKLNLGQNEIVFNKEISIENLSYKYKEKSLVLYGLPGTGKTTIADYILKDWVKVYIKSDFCRLSSLLPSCLPFTEKRIIEVRIKQKAIKLEDSKKSFSTPTKLCRK